MTSDSSDYSDSDDDRKKETKMSASSGESGESSDNSSKVKKRTARGSRPAVIESAGSGSDSDSPKNSGDGDSDEEKEPSTSRKRPSEPSKKKPVKRRKNDHDSKDPSRELFANQEDYEAWHNLGEKDREQKYFELLELADQNKIRDEISQMLAAKSPDDDNSDTEHHRKKEKKKKRVDSDDEDAKPMRGGRSSDSEPDAEFHRPSEVDKKRKQKSAMADLLAKRKDKEKKEAKKASLSIDAVFGKGKDSDSDSDSSSTSSSSNSSRSSSSSRESSPARRNSDDEEVKAARKPVDCREDLVRARISRFKMSKIVHAPFFSDIVTGGFVRIQTGPIPGSKSKYRIAKILGVLETAKVYAFESTRTNKGIKLKFGKHERVYRLEYVSNTDFPVDEFEEWKAVTMSEDTLPTMEHVTKKQRDIQKAMSHNFSNKEVDEMIKEKSRWTKTPRNFAMVKGDLMKKKEYAEQTGDTKAVQELQRKIEDLDSQADLLDKKRSADISAIEWINQRNRNKMKDNFLGDNVQIEMTTQDDPFTRKKDRMKMVSGTKGSLSSTSVTDGSTTAAPALAASSLLPPVVSALASSGSKMHMSKSANDLFSLHGSITKFELDIDLGKLSTTRDVMQKRFDDFESPNVPAPTTQQNESRRLVSLEDYRRRKAANAPASSSNGLSQ